MAMPCSSRYARRHDVGAGVLVDVVVVDGLLEHALQQLVDVVHAGAGQASLLAPWEYRARWYGEDEATARKLAAEIGAGGTVGDKGSS